MVEKIRSINSTCFSFSLYLQHGVMGARPMMKRKRTRRTKKTPDTRQTMRTVQEKESTWTCSSPIEELLQQHQYSSVQQLQQWICQSLCYNHIVSLSYCHIVTLSYVTISLCHTITLSLSSNVRLSHRNIGSQSKMSIQKISYSTFASFQI